MDETLPSNPLAAGIVRVALEVSGRQSHAFGGLVALRDPEGRSFQVDQPIPSALVSVADLQAQILTVIALTSSMREFKPSDLLPPTHASNVTLRLGEIRDLLDQLIGYNNATDSSGILSIDPAAWNITTADGANYRYDSILQSIAGKIGELSDQFGTLQTFANLSFDFGDVVRTATADAAKISALSEKTKRHLDRIDKDNSRYEENLKSIAHTLEQSEKIIAELDNTKRNANENVAEINARIAEIRADTERAANLRATVEGYQADFENFRSRLNEREEKLRQQQNSAAELHERLQYLEADIDRITESANAMLKGATVAGLASVYGNTRDKLSEELKSARRAFYLGIVLLIAFVLPLAGFLLPELGERIRLPHSSPPSDPKLYALQIVARLVLLVPAAWFLRFAANRHAALFRLREEYGHRYALASSVEGFKKQAETFKEEIATATYAHLTANPASTLTNPSKSGDGDPPHPLLSAVMDSFAGKRRDQKTL